MEKGFQITGRIRETSIATGQINFTVDNDMGLTAQINLSIDNMYDKSKSDAFNLLILYEKFLAKVEPDVQLGIAFVYDKTYHRREPWLQQKHYCDDVHHVVQHRFAGIVKKVNVEITIAGQSSSIKDKIDGFFGSLRIKHLTLYDDSNGGDVLNFEEK